MAAITVIDIFTALLGDWSDMGFKGVSDSIGTNYLTHQRRFGTSNQGGNEHVDRFLFRYDKATSDSDILKEILKVTTTNARALIGSNVNYTDVGANKVYMELAMDPFVMLGCLQSAMRKVFERKTLGLGLGNDSDMMLTGVDYWGGGAALGSSAKSNVTVSKDGTTVQYILSNEQALHAVCTGASPYYQGEAIGVIPGTKVLWGHLLYPVVGGVTPRYYDLDHAAFVDTGNDVTFSGQTGVYMQRSFSVPQDCYRMAPVIAGATSTSEWWHSQVFGPYHSQYRLHEALPSWVGEGFQMEVVRPARYLTPISSSTNVFAANSRVWNGDFLQSQDWEAEIHYKAARPNKLAFRQTQPVIEDMGNYPLFIQATREGGVGDPIVDFTSTTELPLNLVLPYFKHQVALTASGQSKDPIWASRLSDTEFDSSFEAVARSIQATPQVARTGYRNIVG